MKIISMSGRGTIVYIGEYPIRLCSRKLLLSPHAKNLSYPLSIEPHPEEGGHLAFFRSLPGCQTWGETYEEAVRNAEEALALFIETLAANGDPIPEPQPVERANSG